MMKTFADRLREDRRLVLLRLLSEQSGYTCNSSNLHGWLLHMGLASSRDDVRTDLQWLREQGLVSLTEPVENLYVAVLGGRGLDVANGHASVPGVSRPTPN